MTVFGNHKRLAQHACIKVWCTANGVWEYTRDSRSTGCVFFFFWLFGMHLVAYHVISALSVCSCSLSDVDYLPLIIKNKHLRLWLQQKWWVGHLSKCHMPRRIAANDPNSLSHTQKLTPPFHLITITYTADLCIGFESVNNAQLVYAKQPSALYVCTVSVLPLAVLFIHLPILLWFCSDITGDSMRAVDSNDDRETNHFFARIHKTSTIRRHRSALCQSNQLYFINQT